MAIKDTSFTAIATAGGVAVVTVSSGAQKWVVQQYSTECVFGAVSGAPIGAQCFVRKNGSIITRLISAGDVASGVPYLELRTGDVSTITWTGVTPGASCKVTAIYDNGV